MSFAPKCTLRYESYGALLHHGRKILKLSLQQTKEIFGRLPHNTVIQRLVDWGMLPRADINLKIIRNPLVIGALTAPIKLYIDLSNECNLECLHCVSCSSPRFKTRLSFDVIRKIADECEKTGIFRVKLGGGEPLMLPDFWNIVDLFEIRGMDVSFSTNGMLVNKHMIEQAVRRSTKISVSIDGSKATNDHLRGRGTFEKAIAAIRMLRGGGLNPAIATTISSYNIREIPLILQLAKKLGVPLKVRRCRPSPRSKENDLVVTKPSEDYFRAVQSLNDSGWPVDMEDIMNVHDNMHYNLLLSPTDCGAGTRSMHISFSGDVSPCVYLGKDFVEGNIGDVGMMRAFRVGKMFSLIRNIAQNSKCAHCPRRIMCHGECPAIRRYVSGFLHGDDPACLKEYLRTQKIQKVKPFPMHLVAVHNNTAYQQGTL